MPITLQTLAKGLTAGLILAAGSLFTAGAAHADRVVIQCPAKVTGQPVGAPAGWDLLRTETALQSTKVIEDGRRDILRCLYGQAGRIERLGPQDATCRATDTGFVCETAPAPAPAPAPVARVYKQGVVTLMGTQTVDLETGRVSPANGADFWFQVQNSRTALIVPQNGAQISPRIVQMGYDGCLNQRYTTQGISLQQIHPGSYVCYKTADGRVGEFLVTAATERAPFSITLDFTTWKR